MVLKVLFLFCLFLLGNSQDLPTPLSVVNPLHIISKQFSSLSTKDIHNLINQNHDIAITNPRSSFLALSKNFSVPGKESFDQCALSLATLLNDSISKPAKTYALKMLDSWGKPESGILEGNFKWIGLYYECLGTQPQNFAPKYCSVYIGKPYSQNTFGLTEQQGVTLGGCFPDTCSTANITSLFSPITSQNKNLSIDAICPEQVTSWDAKDILGLFVLCLILGIVVFSTAYDYVLSVKREKLPYLDDFSQLIDTDHPNNPHVPGKREKLLTSFSIIQNTKRLLITKQRPSDIHCLHGLRFFSMCWVILGHSFLFPVSFIDNLIFTARYYVEHWHFQAVGNATFSVDSFFFLSGLLVAYLGMRQLKKSNGRMNIAMMYFYRYVRLTPPYALLILLSVSVWPKLGDGPMWSGVASNLGKACSKYWYSNLLYFNNLYPVEMGQECYGWGWYLANDTQFYLLSPIFLYLLYKSPMAGILSASLVTLASITVTGAFSSHTNQQPQALGIALIAKAALGAGSNSTSLLAASQPAASYNQYMYDLYAKPWCRIGAYLIGMITGYILSRGKIRMSRWIALLGWVLAAVANSMVVYGLYPTFSKGGFQLVPENILDNNTAAFYNAVSRPVWCLGLAWLVLACHNGYGGPVNTFLSWRGFIPLSRLTYCTYLVHPLVIWWLVATSETLLHYSIELMIMIFSGTLILSSLFAYFVSMIIEMPVVELMKMLQNRDGNPGPVKQVAVNGEADRSPLVNEENA